MLKVAKENLGGDLGPGFCSIPAIINNIWLIEEKMYVHEMKNNAFEQCMKKMCVRGCVKQKKLTRNGKAKGDDKHEEQTFAILIIVVKRRYQTIDDIFVFENRNDFPIKEPIAALYMDTLISI